ncbi:hypothetical protein [Pontibacter diazotrophicus]|uniref:hypothetical protein n=1 Tax=Pontibacter diazotrophicus TaxID=1400979 RepID=UPI0015F171CC|nr:hypothetical protein [Pontibacter diazotrophicus]
MMGVGGVKGATGTTCFPFPFVTVSPDSKPIKAFAEERQSQGLTPESIAVATG